MHEDRPKVDAVDFDAVIDGALDELPAPFAEQLGSVAIVVEDEPSPDQLASGRGAWPVRALPGHPADALGR